MIKRLKKFFEYYNYLLKSLIYIKSEDVFQLIINSFTREIDLYTIYLSSYNTEQFNSEINVFLKGIGIVLKQNNKDIFITSIISRSSVKKK